MVLACSRICEQLAILRRQEKDVNRLRWQYEMKPDGATEKPGEQIGFQ
jgi:hypothetical protein